MDWPTDIDGARRLQVELAGRVRCVPPKEPLFLVAGVDAAFSKDRVFASACLYDLSSLAPLEDAETSRKLTFPYVPGLLVFREGPAVLDAVKALKQRPDVILVDGQGIAHPRRFGFASHLGVLLGLPTIGCAKSRLIGEFLEPCRERGCRSPLEAEGETVGAVLRTRDGVRPLFISPGHLIDVDTAVRVVLESCAGFRVPEPLRRADRLSRAACRAAG